MNCLPNTLDVKERVLEAQKFVFAGHCGCVCLFVRVEVKVKIGVVRCSRRGAEMLLERGATSSH